jgi:hypothetical protein
MCLGILDPKHVMREAEQRLGSFPRRSAAADDKAPVSAFGLWARVRRALARLNVKEASDV